MHGSFGWVLVLWLAACGGSKAGASTGGDVDVVRGEETERERLARLATDKREQCEAVGNALQESETGGTQFVNLNDATKLKALSDKRVEIARKIGAMKVTAEGLVAVVDDYVQLNLGMVEALGSMKEAPGEAEQKRGLERYRELEGQVDGIFERFNQTCDGR